MSRPVKDSALVAGARGAAIALVVVMLLNVPNAVAQATDPGGSTVDVLAALVGQEVVATRYTATATTGAGYTCNATIASCFKMPGADFVIGSDGNYVLIGPSASTTVKLKVGEAFIAQGNGNVLMNGSLDFYNGGFMTRSIGGAVLVDDAQGLRVAAKTLGTCGADTPEGAELVDAAAGGTTGARTRKCICTSDGSATPAYAWQNMVTGTLGTTTTCAP